MSDEFDVEHSSGKRFNYEEFEKDFSLVAAYYNMWQDGLIASNKRKFDFRQLWAAQKAYHLALTGLVQEWDFAEDKTVIEERLGAEFQARYMVTRPPMRPADVDPIELARAASRRPQQLKADLDEMSTDELRNTIRTLLGSLHEQDTLVRDVLHEQEYEISQWVPRLKDLQSVMSALQSQIDQAVLHARFVGVTWKQIGEIFDITPQSAQRRYTPESRERHRNAAKLRRRET